MTSVRPMPGLDASIWNRRADVARRRRPRDPSRRPVDEQRVASSGRRATDHVTDVAGLARPPGSSAIIDQLRVARTSLQPPRRVWQAPDTSRRTRASWTMRIEDDADDQQHGAVRPASTTSRRDGIGDRHPRLAARRAAAPPTTLIGRSDQAIIPPPTASTPRSPRCAAAPSRHSGRRTWACGPDSPGRCSRSPRRSSGYSCPHDVCRDASRSRVSRTTTFAWRRRDRRQYQLRRRYGRRPEDRSAACRRHASRPG